MRSSVSADAEFWRHRSVLVTGGTGFLGSHLVRALVRLDADVVVLVRDGVRRTSVAESWRGLATEVYGVVEDHALLERLLSEYGCQTVFHLAAQTQVEVAAVSPASTLNTNIEGTISVLEACRRTPFVEQVVTASSDKAYGDHELLPYGEDSSLRAIHPYDVSKACVDMVSRSYALSFGLPAVITRCGNFFGPGDTNWRRLVPGSVRAVVEGRDPVIRSDGTAMRDYLYIADAVSGYLSLAENLARRPDLAGEAFNFAEGRPRRVIEVVEQIIRACGSERVARIENRMEREIAHQALDVTKAHEVLSWNANHDFAEALDETVRWYRTELTGGQR